VKVIKNITNKHEMSKLWHGIHIATRRLSKTCILVLLDHCHSRLEFMDVNAWKTWIWKYWIHHLSVFKLLHVPIYHNGDLIFDGSSFSSLNDVAFPHCLKHLRWHHLSLSFPCALYCIFDPSFFWNEKN
jgi:hypothetical protein